MQTVFSTDQVHARDRFDYWHSVACQRIVEHETIPADRLNFGASIEVGGLGNLELVQFHNSPMQVGHTLAHLARARSDQLFVCYQVSGSVFMAQNAREVTLNAGTLTLIDPLLPYDCRFLDGSKTLVVKVPRLELRARLGRNRELVARLVRPVQVDDSLAGVHGATLIIFTAIQLRTINAQPPVPIRTGGSRSSPSYRERDSIWVGILRSHSLRPARRSIAPPRDPAQIARFSRLTRRTHTTRALGSLRFSRHHWSSS